MNSPVRSIPLVLSTLPSELPYEAVTAAGATPLAEAASDLPRPLCRPPAFPYLLPSFPYLLPSARVFQPLVINSPPAAICRARESKKQKTSRVKMTGSAPAKGAPTHCDVFVGRLQARKDTAALIY